MNDGLWHGRNPPLGEASETFLRYSYAASFVLNRLVLDIGCGSGEGAFVLSRTAQGVVAVDASVTAARYGRDKYARESGKIFFVAASGEHLPFRPAVFDVATMFEVIEHVENPESLLDEVKSILRKGGKTVISTPNKSFSSPNLKSPLTYWHTKEFYPEEFIKLLSRGFKVSERLGVATKHRRSRLDSGPIFAILKLIDSLPPSGNLTARRFLCSRLGYALTDFAFGKTEPSKVWIETVDLRNAYCIIAVCEKK